MVEISVPVNCTAEHEFSAAELGLPGFPTERLVMVPTGIPTLDSGYVLQKPCADNPIDGQSALVRNKDHSKLFCHSVHCSFYNPEV